MRNINYYFNSFIAMFNIAENMLDYFVYSFDYIQNKRTLL